MRILQKRPYVTSEGIMVDFGDRLYRRRGKEAIPSYSYLPDEVYCMILGLEGTKVRLGGLNPLLQNREDLRRLCFLLKEGLPEKEYPVYYVELCSDIPFEKLVDLRDSSDSQYFLNTLKHIDIVVERTGQKRVVDVQQSLKQNKTILYERG